MNKRLFLAKLSEHGFTRKSFAVKVKRSHNTICNQVNSKSDLTTNDVKLYCNVLNITSADEKNKIFLE